MIGNRKIHGIVMVMAIAQQFNKMLGEGASLKKEDISGQVKLAGLTKAADIECLDLRMAMTIKNFAPPAPDPTAKVEKGEFTASMTGALPLDPAIPMLGGKHTLTSAVTIRMKAPNGDEAVLEMKTENTSTKSDIPIRK